MTLPDEKPAQPPGPYYVKWTEGNPWAIGLYVEFEALGVDEPLYEWQRHGYDYAQEKPYVIGEPVPMPVDEQATLLLPWQNELPTTVGMYLLRQDGVITLHEIFHSRPYELFAVQEDGAAVLLANIRGQWFGPIDTQSKDRSETSGR